MQDQIDLLESDDLKLVKEEKPRKKLKFKFPSMYSVRKRYSAFRKKVTELKLERAKEKLTGYTIDNNDVNAVDKIKKRAKHIAKLEGKLKYEREKTLRKAYIKSRAIKLSNKMIAEVRMNADETYWNLPPDKIDELLSSTQGRYKPEVKKQPEPKKEINLEKDLQNDLSKQVTAAMNEEKAVKEQATKVETSMANNRITSENEQQLESDMNKEALDLVNKAKEEVKPVETINQDTAKQAIDNGFNEQEKNTNNNAQRSFNQFNDQLMHEILPKEQVVNTVEKPFQPKEVVPEKIETEELQLPSVIPQMGTQLPSVVEQKGTQLPSVLEEREMPIVAPERKEEAKEQELNLNKLIENATSTDELDELLQMIKEKEAQQEQSKQEVEAAKAKEAEAKAKAQQANEEYQAKKTFLLEKCNAIDEDTRHNKEQSQQITERAQKFAEEAEIKMQKAAQVEKMIGPVATNVRPVEATQSQGKSR